ncbi:MAG: helix-turn-helix transcriptional regulator [Eubacteriales bacterium]|nr:helix-turn-helix transcriptional regulator [Eubacteriales bacterium]
MLRLTQERKRRKLTQSEVAQIVGATKQGVCDWEKSRSFPRRQTLLKLETLFNMSHQKLFELVSDEDSFSSVN